MDIVILATAFAGSWLFVVGPLLQAGIELMEASRTAHDFSHRQPSPLWWFIPPLMYLRSQRGLEDRDPRTQVYRLRATGWFAVAGGGALVAVSTTWDVVQYFGLGVVSFALMYLVMCTLCSAYTAVRMIMYTPLVR